MKLRAPHRRSRNRGSVLIIVLWVALGLVTIALLFGHSAMLDFRAAENLAAGWQAEQAIEAGLRYAIYLIENLEVPGSIPALEPYQSGPVPVGEAYFWFIGREHNYLSSTHPFFGIQDEAAKLNLNTATQEMLEALPFMTPHLVGSILDWRDEDEDSSENGAESTTYLQRNPPYEAKNAPFDSIDELHMLAGAEPIYLFGEDINQNGVLDPNENDGETSYPPDNQDGRLDLGILEYVTVHTQNPITGSEESQVIDLNNDEDNQLSALLEETFGEERANEIRTPGNNATYQSVLEYFQFSGMTMGEFAQIERRLAVNSEDGPKALINVNTASEAVLACVPGIGPENAANVVAQRQSNEPGTSTVTWIHEILDEDATTEAGPYLTGSTSQYLIDIAAVGRGGKGYRRTQFVIDTLDSVKVVSRRDLPRAGWALGEQTRLQLAERKQNPMQ
ncbi:MAG: hypothetical protein M2R45_00036 [Verrucomicrobia subdivision 3 bacterium]|nr:hypothetical protein [Limisphaerales bacterium]MCS1412505.1 hypothetical protein [Limisphaerales bacterium]